MLLGKPGIRTIILQISWESTTRFNASGVINIGFQEHPKMGSGNNTTLSKLRSLQNHPIFLERRKRGDVYAFITKLGSPSLVLFIVYSSLHNVRGLPRFILWQIEPVLQFSSQFGKTLPLFVLWQIEPVYSSLHFTMFRGWEKPASVYLETDRACLLSPVGQRCT